MITLIWAMDRNRLIGNHDQLPWPRIAADMRWFRQHTLGKTIVMGRATFDSLGRKALAKRRNIVLSRQPQAQVPNVEWLSQLEALEQLAAHEEVIIIGGAQIYCATIPLADRLIYTEIDATFNGDTWFPQLIDHQWTTEQRTTLPAEEDSPYPMRFTIANRCVKESNYSAPIENIP
ncbi:MAG: dihydrofolate reductase [Mariprofundales bacterium]|nr:dihydrofolate reductase [Mariprofundales bacterium]